MKISNGLATLRHGFTMFVLIIGMGVLTPWPAGAVDTYQLEVTYTSGSIIFGPLSFGLSTLPTSVTATFTLGPGQPGTEPGEEDELFFDETDVNAASISFGDATWTASAMENFSLPTDSGNINDLAYAFLSINTLHADGGIVLNFPLKVTGTDRDTGQPFEYRYTTSTQTLTPLPQTLPITIDILPGSDQNCLNMNGHGVVPVAIFGSEDLDVNQINLDSLFFDGLTVRVRGKKGPLCAIEDVNGDVYLDMVCHFEDERENWTAGNDEATVTGALLDETRFEGTDSICIVPTQSDMPGSAN